MNFQSFQNQALNTPIHTSQHDNNNQPLIDPSTDFNSENAIDLDPDISTADVP